jgi:DNA-binding transcriptional LysR family regulator
LDRSKPAVADLNEAIEAARYLGDRPAGLLRINILRAAIEPLFAPILAGFCEAYPEIELEIFAEDGFSDLSADGFDCGVRLGESLDADMVAVRLYDPFRFVAAATPAYLDRYGRPKTIAELSKHRCIRLRLATGAFMSWQFMQGNRLVETSVNGPIIVNDFTAQRIAMMSGVAIGYIAEPSIIEEVQAGNLELLFDDMAVTSGGAFLYYPSKRQVMPKLRAFIDYVRATLPLQRPS